MDTDILKKSVTRDDHPTSPYQSGVLHFILGSPTQRNGLPVYWSPARDYFLRMILYTEFHDFWSGAIGIAVTKMSSLAWDLESSQPRVRNDFQELLLAADNNQSWTSFLARHLQDFLGTDNGAFIEVVHATQGYGSKILGLMHLDSWRCTRTGDPDIPVLYRDTLGRIHEMRPHQVMCFADMPSPAETYHGVGLCATSRAWGAIRKMEAIERYIYEKVSGDRALALHFIGGILPKDISDGIQAAKESNEARGNTSYMGAITIPVPSDQPLNLITIPFAELPDGFDYDKQINNAILVYANSLGLDVQDLQPLTGRALGTGAQSQVLEDKSRGKGLAAWRQQWTHMTNEYVLPDTVTFAFSEKDMRDQQRQADINKTYADTVTGLVTSNILTTQQAQQILADNDVIPQEFVPEDTTPVEAISDTEKPQVEADAQEQVSEMPTETPPPTEQTPTEKEAQTSANPFAIDSHDLDTTEKSVKQVTRRFHADLRNLATLGFISDKSILGEVRKLVKDAIADAYTEGLKEGGIAEADMTDEDAQAIVTFYNEQAPFITEFVKAIRAAKEDRAQQRDILDNRVNLWTQTIESIGAQGLASAKSNQMGTWHYGDTDHCETCEKLNGKRHRLKWFTSQGYIPRQPGSATLKCHGYNCQCFVTSDSGERLM